MVDVSHKPETVRVATAQAIMKMQEATADAIRAGTMKKGDVLQVARIAAIQGVKATPQWIPLCHPLIVEAVEVSFEWQSVTELLLKVTVRTTGKTGVEMEALCGASAGMLTVYDMCKSIDRTMELGPLRLLHKSGGMSNVTTVVPTVESL